MDLVRLRHPDTGGEFVTTRSALGSYVAAGWQVVDEDVDPDALTLTEPESTSGDPTRTGRVLMRHPDTGGQYLAPAAAVPIHEASGWQVVKDTDPVQPAAAGEAPPEQPEPPSAEQQADDAPTTRKGRRTTTTVNEEKPDARA